MRFLLVALLCALSYAQTEWDCEEQTSERDCLMGEDDGDPCVWDCADEGVGCLCYEADNCGSQRDAASCLAFTESDGEKCVWLDGTCSDHCDALHGSDDWACLLDSHCAFVRENNPGECDDQQYICDMNMTDPTEAIYAATIGYNEATTREQILKFAQAMISTIEQQIPVDPVYTYICSENNRCLTVQLCGHGSGQECKTYGSRYTVIIVNEIIFGSNVQMVFPTFDNGTICEACVTVGGKYDARERPWFNQPDGWGDPYIFTIPTDTDISHLPVEPDLRFSSPSDRIYGVTHTTRKGGDFFVVSFDALDCGYMVMAEFSGWNACNSTHPCPAGVGDCDRDSDCMTGYCNTQMEVKEGTVEGYMITFLPPGVDICTDPPGTLVVFESWDQCSKTSPCADGMANCNRDDACEGDLLCFRRTSGQYFPGYDFSQLPNIANIDEANVCVQPLTNVSLCVFSELEVHQLVVDYSDLIRDILADRSSWRHIQKFVMAVMTYDPLTDINNYISFENGDLYWLMSCKHRFEHCSDIEGFDTQNYFTVLAIRYEHYFQDTFIHYFHVTDFGKVDFEFHVTEVHYDATVRPFWNVNGWIAPYRFIQPFSTVFGQSYSYTFTLDGNTITASVDSIVEFCETFGIIYIDIVENDYCEQDNVCSNGVGDCVSDNDCAEGLQCLGKDYWTAQNGYNSLTVSSTELHTSKACIVVQELEESEGLSLFQIILTCITVAVITIACFCYIVLNPDLNWCTCCNCGVDMNENILQQGVLSCVYLVFDIGDFLTDWLAFRVLNNNEEVTPTFLFFYLIFIMVASFVMIYTVMVRGRRLHDLWRDFRTPDERVPLDMEVEKSREVDESRVALFSVLSEDLPFFVMNLVFIYRVTSEDSWIVEVSLLISALCIGIKSRQAASICLELSDTDASLKLADIRDFLSNQFPHHNETIRKSQHFTVTDLEKYMRAATMDGGRGSILPTVGESNRLSPFWREPGDDAIENSTEEFHVSVEPLSNAIRPGGPIPLD